MMDATERLRNTIRFILDCMIADGWAAGHPATWGHILRELKRCGMEVTL